MKMTDDSLQTATTWARHPSDVLVQRGAAERFSHLGVLPTIVSLLNTSDLAFDEAHSTESRCVWAWGGDDQDRLLVPPLVRLRPAPGHPRRAVGLLVREFVNQGGSLKIRRLDYDSDRLAELAASIETQGGVPTGVMGYISGPASQGWGAHYDRHAGLIFQISGSKHWTVYEPIEPDPVRPQSPYKVTSRVRWSGVVDAGTLLCIPRGFGHLVEGTAERSVHITVPLNLPVVADRLRLTDERCEFVPAAPPFLPTTRRRRSTLFALRSALDDTSRRLAHETDAAVATRGATFRSDPPADAPNLAVVSGAARPLEPWELCAPLDESSPGRRTLAKTLRLRLSDAQDQLQTLLPHVGIVSLMRSAGWDANRRSPVGTSLAGPLRHQLADAEAAMNSILAADLRSGRAVLAQGGSAINRPLPAGLVDDPADPAAPHRINLERLAHLLNDDGTLIVLGSDEHYKPLGRLAALLERVGALRSGSNTYVSTGTEVSGFGPHWDDHDLLVVHAEGQKRWQLHQPVDVAPQQSVHAVGQVGPQRQDLTLSAGDALFIPRGWGHTVTGLGGLSVHHTFPLRHPLAADYLGGKAEDVSIGPSTLLSDRLRFAAAVPPRHLGRLVSLDSTSTPVCASLASTAGVYMIKSGSDSQDPSLIRLATGGWTFALDEPGLRELADLIGGRVCRPASAPPIASSEVSPWQNHVLTPVEAMLAQVGLLDLTDTDGNDRV